MFRSREVFLSLNTNAGLCCHFLSTHKIRPTVHKTVCYLTILYFKIHLCPMKQSFVVFVRLALCKNWHTFLWYCIRISKQIWYKLQAMNHNDTLISINDTLISSSELWNNFYSVVVISGPYMQMSIQAIVGNRKWAQQFGGAQQLHWSRRFVLNCTNVIYQ